MLGEFVGVKVKICAIKFEDKETNNQKEGKKSLIKNEITTDNYKN